LKLDEWRTKIIFSSSINIDSFLSSIRIFSACLGLIHLLSHQSETSLIWLVHHHWI